MLRMDVNRMDSRVDLQVVAMDSWVVRIYSQVVRIHSLTRVSVMLHVSGPYYISVATTGYWSPSNFYVMHA